MKIINDGIRLTRDEIRSKYPNGYIIICRINYKPEPYHNIMDTAEVYATSMFSNELDRIVDTLPDQLKPYNSTTTLDGRHWIDYDGKLYEANSDPYIHVMESYKGM